MPPFVPRTRQEAAIDRQLAEVGEKRRQARSVIREALTLLGELDVEEDSLLALRSAETARRRHPW